MKQIKIYTLSDPITGEIRYVGKTKSELGRRLYNHIYEAKNTQIYSHRLNWIRHLLNIGVYPVIALIEYVDDPSTWKDLEKYWIMQMKVWGFNLVNGTTGGDDIPPGFTMLGKNHTKEARQKISDSRIGIIFSETTRKKMSVIKKGKSLSDEHKNNLYKAYGNKYRLGMESPMKNNKHSDESKKKMSDAKKGKTPWNKGIGHTDESKKKMSDAKKGKTPWNKGKKMSEEFSEKISMVTKGRIPWNKGNKK